MMEVSLALLAFSAPITASLIVFRPQRNNGKYVTTREYDSFRADLSDRLGGLENELHDLNKFVRSRL